MITSDALTCQGMTKQKKMKVSSNLKLRSQKKKRKRDSIISELVGQ